MTAQYVPADAEVRRWALEAAVRRVGDSGRHIGPERLCLDAQVFERYLRTGSPTGLKVPDDALAVAEAAGVVPEAPGLGRVVDLLALIADEYPGPTVTTAEAASWSFADREAVHVWAAKAHLAASDNGVEVPPLPRVLTREVRSGILLDLTEGLDRSHREQLDEAGRL